jgi:hypothetical protein
MRADKPCPQCKRYGVDATGYQGGLREYICINRSCPVRQYWGGQSVKPRPQS